MKPRNDFDWGAIDRLLFVPLALFLIWREPGAHRRTKAHSIPRERRSVVKAHGRRKGDWVTVSVRAGWMVPTLTALALSGCPMPERAAEVPNPTPLSGPVRPGATCEPVTLAGTAGDGTPMVCGSDGRWRMAVRDR